MKAMFRKYYGLLASLALFTAVTTLSSTCFYTAYQPDMPDELSAYKK